MLGGHFFFRSALDYQPFARSGDSRLQRCLGGVVPRSEPRVAVHAACAGRGTARSAGGAAKHPAGAADHPTRGAWRDKSVVWSFPDLQADFADLPPICPGRA